MASDDRTSVATGPEINSNITDKNGSKCIICYGPHASLNHDTKSLCPGNSVEIEHLAAMFAECFDVTLPKRFYEYGKFHFCGACVSKLKDLEGVFEEFYEVKSRFDKARSGVAQVVLQSIQTSSYIDSNSLNGNTFDATRSLIFKRWCKWKDDEQPVQFRNVFNGLTRQENIATNNPTMKQTSNCSPSLTVTPLFKQPFSKAIPHLRISANTNSKLTITPPNRDHVVTVTKASSSRQIKIVKDSTGLSAIQHNTVEQQQDDGFSSLVISKVESLSTLTPDTIADSQGNNSKGSNSQSLTSTVVGSTVVQNGSDVNVQNGLVGPVTRVCTANKIDSQTASFAAQAIVLKPNSAATAQPNQFVIATYSKPAANSKTNFTPVVQAKRQSTTIASNLNLTILPKLAKRSYPSPKDRTKKSTKKVGSDAVVSTESLRIKRCPRSGKITHVVTPDQRFRGADIDEDEENGILTITPKGGTASDARKYRFKPRLGSHLITNSNESRSPPKLERMDIPDSNEGDKVSEKSIPVKELFPPQTSGMSIIEHNPSDSMDKPVKLVPKTFKKRILDQTPSPADSSESTKEDGERNGEKTKPPALRISGRSGRAIKRPYGDSSTWVSEDGEIDKLVAEEVAAFSKKRRARQARKSAAAKEVSPRSPIKVSDPDLTVPPSETDDEMNSNQNEDLVLTDGNEDVTGPADDSDLLQIENNESYQCSFCDDEFSDPKEKEAHEETHEEDEDYNMAQNTPEIYHCEMCSDSLVMYTTMDELLTHRSQKHEGRKIFTCRSCNLEFSAKKEYQNHIASEHEVNEFKCGICGNNSNTPEDFEEHKAEHNSNGNGYHKCQHCYMAFATLPLFVQHQIKRHAKKQAHRCDRCLQLFPDMSALRTHQRVQIMSEQHSCSICNEKYSWTCALKIHLESHSPNFQKNCAICNEELNSLSEWETHQANAHTEELGIVVG